MIKNILLAEDDRGTALLVKTFLESKNYTVFTAPNGLEALNVLSFKPIDLIITDVVMPKMDGVDLYAAVKKNPKTARIPIIIVTDKAVFKESFASLGVSNFVEKTTDINLLLEKIKSINDGTQQAIKYPKILISSSHKTVLDQTVKALKEEHYLTFTVKTSQELLSQAISLRPDAIIMDVLFQDDNASAGELIKALRCFGFLSNSKIITYAVFAEDLGIDVESIQAVEEGMKICNQAGADLYIGRFNPSFLLEKLQDLGI